MPDPVLCRYCGEDIWGKSPWVHRKECQKWPDNPGAPLDAQTFLALLPKLPANVRRFRAGDFEVELDGPVAPSKPTPTTAQAEAAYEAAKPRPPSDIDSLGMTPPMAYLEDEPATDPS